jgi:hypothetical protein
VERALGNARDGYVSLAAALRAGDHDAYVRAARSIRRAEAAVDDGLRSLRRLGYRTSRG